MNVEESKFYVTGGTLQYDAPCYVERQGDAELFSALIKGEFCYVLTSRQMGKSSLMVRTAQRLREHNLTVTVLDLTAIGQNVTPEQWYGGLLNRLGGQLRLEDNLDSFWSKHRELGPAQRFFTAIRQAALPEMADPLIIFVDELDIVRSLPFSTDEFFAAIRECYTRRTEDSEFDRLTFCLLGVATPSDLIRDTRLTPFNIGKRIELDDFTEDEAAPLAKGLGIDQAEGDRHGEELARAVLKRVLHWTNGHPYLTQRLCRAVAQPEWDRVDKPNRYSISDAEEWVDTVCAKLFLSSRARERDDNLLFVRERLLRSEVDRATLLNFYAQVQKGRKRIPF